MNPELLARLAEGGLYLSILLLCGCSWVIGFVCGIDYQQGREERGSDDGDY
jgi:hypothetical protein